MKKIIFWIDDERDPNTNYLGDSDYPSWVEIYNKNYFKFEDYTVYWLKSYDEFTDMLVHGNIYPDAVCFDHDLGYGKDGYECAKFLIDYCQNYNTVLPLFFSQSANPTGKMNILGILKNYKKFQEENI